MHGPIAHVGPVATAIHRVEPQGLGAGHGQAHVAINVAAAEVGDEIMVPLVVSPANHLEPKPRLQLLRAGCTGQLGGLDTHNNLCTLGA